MIQWNGYFYLFYSTGGFSQPTYQQNCARSRSLTGPYLKSPQPVVGLDKEKYKRRVNCTWEGPGHGSVVTDIRGDRWLIYHAWVYGGVGTNPPGRQMLLDKLILGEEGWPMVINRVPSDTPMMGPLTV